MFSKTLSAAHLPLSVVTGLGLGVSHSSLTKTEVDVLPAQSLGSAKIECAVNAATGNIHVKDHTIKIASATGGIEFGYIYNSQAKTPWQVGLKRLLTPINKNAQQITLVEADGHEVQFNYDPTTNCYHAAEYVQGQQTLHFDQEQQAWILTKPGSEISEYFSEIGQLCLRRDKRDRCTKFFYQEDGKLKSIVSENGYEYRFAYYQNAMGEVVQIFSTDPVGQSILLKTYQFNNDNQLLSTTTGDQYKIQYAYEANRIAHLVQDDGSQLHLNYNAQGELERIHLGDIDDVETAYHFQYHKSSANIIDPLGKVVELKWDKKANLLSTTRIHDGQEKKNCFKYNEAGQLKYHSDPANNETFIAYDQQGLITHYQDLVKEETRFYYAQEGEKVLLAKAQLLRERNKERLLVERNVYEASKTNQRLLRFTISPAGRVKEYIYEDGSLKKIKTFKANFFISNVNPEEAIPIDALINWSAQQPKRQIKLVTVTENQAGQITAKEEFAEIDVEGNGISNEHANREQFVYDDANLLLEHHRQHDKDIDANESVEYDQLARPLAKKNALGYATKFDYQQNKTIKILPNHRQEITQQNAKGKITEGVVIAKNGEGEEEVHKEKIIFDKCARPFITINAEGKKSYLFYNDEHEVHISVSPLGTVTEYIRHTDPVWVEKIIYDTPVDIRQLALKNNFNKQDLQSAICLNPNKDQHTITFFDAGARVRLTIDGNGFITQPLYDSLHRDLGELRFKDKFSSTEIEKLKSQGMTSLQANQHSARLLRKFYDDDGLLIATTDEAGYITHYLRDGAGEITDKIVYAKRNNTLTPETTFDELNLSKLKEHAHTYYFRDARGRVVLEVDPKGYITTFEYLRNDLIVKSKRFATRINSSWYANTKLLPLPNASPNDEVTIEYYDLLQRQVKLTETNGKVTEKTYDDMGNNTSERMWDQNQVSNINGDTHRAQYKVFDAFGNVIAELNPYVANQLAVLQAKPMLTEEVRAKNISDLWQSLSTKYIRNTQGLLIRKIDSLGHVTLYFYDDESRLVASIDPTGAVTQKEYDNRSNCTKIRVHVQRLEPKKLLLLKGGFADANTIQLLNTNQSPEDSVEQKKYNTRDLIEESIDANKCRSEWTYNAFKEIEIECLPVHGNEPTLTITHKRDERGNDIETTKEAADIKVMTSKRFDHPFNLLTKQVDENKIATQYKYDKLNRLTKISKGGREELIETDAFNCITSRKDAAKKILRFEHDAKENVEKLIAPDGNLIQTIKKNIFDEKIKNTNGLGQSESWRHEPDGQLLDHVDAMNNPETVTKHNTEGWLEIELNAKGMLSTYECNAAGQLTNKIEDVAGLNLKTTFEPNVFGQAEKIVRPDGVIKLQLFNKRQALLSTIEDPKSEKNPQGLNIQTTYVCNACDQVTDIFKGEDEKGKNNQWHLKITHDGLGRVVESTIDPEGLQIKAADKLDAKGRVLTKVNELGQLSYFVYNEHDEIIFTISPEGGVIGYEYNQSGLKNFERQYVNLLKPEELKQDFSLIELKQKLHAIEALGDNIKHFIYDDLKREQYIVEVFVSDRKNQSPQYQGIVTEKKYDSASRINKIINYFHPIDLHQYEALKCEQIETLIQPVADKDKDNVVSFIHDAKGNVRFTIYANGKVEENVFDSNNNIIKHTIYGNKLEDTEHIAYDEFSFSKKIKDLANLEKDSTKYFIYDRLNRLVYKINPERGLTKWEYDAAHRKTAIIKFANPIPIVPDEDEHHLIQRLDALSIDPKKDSITRFKWDNKDRLKQAKDPLGNEDTYNYDALDNTISHTDRGNHTWTYTFDRAKRMVKEISPQTEITHIVKMGKHLSSSIEKTKIVKRMVYDQAGNINKIIHADGLVEAREVETTYNSDHQVTSTKVGDVLIDHYADTANFEASPEIPADLVHLKVYDGRKQAIAERDAGGFWQYKSYDTLGRLTYEINKKGKVTEYCYNTLNQVTQVIEHAFPMEIDAEYQGRGLPCDQIAKKIVNVPEQDRITEFKYDRAGNVTDLIQGEIFYYANGEYGLAKPALKKTFDSLGQCTSEAKLISANVWAKTYYWHDRNGKVVASVDPKGHLTTITRTPFGKEKMRIDYADPLPFKPAEKTKLTELKTGIVQNKDGKDRILVYQYDLLGQKISQKEVNVQWENVELDQAGIPKFEKIYGDLETMYAYDAMQHLISITLPDGGKQWMYYDARGFLCAETEPTRVPIKGENVLPLTPLTTYGVDAFGKQVLKIKHKNSASGTDRHIKPDVAADEKDQIELKLFDKRGKIKYLQDAMSHLFATTYTANAQIARQYHDETTYRNNGVVNGQPSYSRIDHIDEVKYIYGIEEHPTSQVILRDNIARFAKYSQYNIFDEFIAEGRDGINYPLKQHYDRAGRIWLSNKTGASTITLRDLGGNETLTMQAADFDIGKSIYQDIPDLIQNTKGVDRTEKIYDVCGNMETLKASFWAEKNFNGLPTHRYVYDRWHNILEEFDSFNHKTSYLYNHRNQEQFRLEPETTDVDIYGNAQRLSPWTKFSHDVMGRLIGKTNTYFYTEGYFRDNAGQIVLKVLPDGTREETTVYDIFGNPIETYSAGGACTRHVFDLRNQLNLTVEPNGLYRWFDHDSAGNQCLITDSYGLYHRMNYFNGAVIGRFKPLANYISYINDYNGLPINETREVNHGIMGKNWQRDYFGRVDNYYNLNGSLTHFDYNFKGEKKHEESSSLYRNPRNNRLRINTTVDYNPGDVFQEFPIVDHFPFEYPDTKVNVDYHHARGLLTDVIDCSYGTVSHYDHDSEGRRIYLKVIENNVLVKESSAQYDELGRDAVTYDSLLTASNYFSSIKKLENYDAVNNRRSTGYIFNAAGYAKNCRVPEQQWRDWFTYDIADRVLLSQSDLNAKHEHLLPPGKGVRLSYLNNLRKTEERCLPNGQNSRIELIYDADEDLYRTASYAYTADRRETQAPSLHSESYKETFISPDNGTWINTVLNKTSDNNGREYYNQYFEGNLNKSSTSKHYLTTGEVPDKQITIQLGANTHLIRNDYNIFYAYLDEPVPIYAAGTRIEYGQTSAGDSLMFHYPNGMVQGKILTADEHNYELKAAQPKVHFDATHDGILMSKRLVRAPIDRVYHRDDAYTKGYYYFSDVNNNFLGQYSELFHPNANVGTNSHGYNHQKIHEQQMPCGIKPIVSDILFPSFPQPVGRVKANSKADANNPPGLLDGPLIPSKQTLYVTQPGDTFASIAAHHCGDAEFGEAIAKKNGFLSYEPLKAGRIIFIPSYIANKNKAWNKNHLNKFLNTIQGSILPYIPNPPPKSDHPNYLKVIAKIVAVTIALYAASVSAPWLMGYFASMGIPMNEMTLKGVLASLSDAGAQGLSLLVGAQDRFSTTELLETGITGGLSAPALDNLNSARIVNQLKGTLELAAISVGTQFAEMKLGLRDKFDAGDVAVQVLGAYAAMKIEKKLDSVLGDSKAKRPVTRATKTVTRSGLNAAIKHTPIDAEMIGSEVIGENIADEVIEKADAHIKGATASQKDDTDYIKERERIRQEATFEDDPDVQAASEVANYALPKPALNYSPQAQADYNSAHPEQWNDFSRGSKVSQMGIWGKKPSTGARKIDIFPYPMMKEKNITLGDIPGFRVDLLLAGFIIAPLFLSAPIAGALGTVATASVIGPVVEGPMLEFLTGQVLRQTAGRIGAWLGASKAIEKFGILGGKSKAIGLTTRLNRTQIKEYLANAQNMPREQLIQDLESVGLKLKGESPSGLFKTFEDKAGNLRVKIHPADASTDYSHIHIYDKAANSLTQNLTRAPYDLPDVHIRVEPIQKELEWSLRRQK